MMVFNTVSPYTIPEVLHDHNNAQFLESTICHIIHKAFHVSGKCCYPILQPMLQISQALKKAGFLSLCFIYSQGTERYKLLQWPI